MKWSNLKNNRCPECGGDMAVSKRLNTTMGAGMQHTCGFTISDRKFEQIVSDKIKASLMTPDAPVIEEDFI